MSTEETIAEFPREGEIEETEGTSPSESQSEKEEAGEKPSQGGETNIPEEDKLPFHKHPRWIEKQEEIQELKERLEQFEQSKQEVVRPEATELPEWWKNYYGNDERSVGAYQEYVKQTEAFQSTVEQKVLDAIEKREQEKVRIEQEADSYIDSEIESLQKTEKFEKNELMKFMLDFEDQWGVPIVNEEGQYDFAKGLQMMNQYVAKEPVSDVKKKVAGLTTRSTSTRSSDRDTTIPSHQLRRGGWIPPRDQ